MHLRVAVAAALSFAVTAILVLIVFDRLHSDGRIPRPEAGTRSGYELTFQIAGSGARRQAIGADGSGCEALSLSSFLVETCKLATFTETPYIGASAQGRLNVEFGPAVEALMWRAWLSSRVEACASGGLLNEGLAKCQATVGLQTYSVSDAGVEVSLGPR